MACIKIFALGFIIFSIQSRSHATTFNVVTDFKADSTGKLDATIKFQLAWTAACNSTGQATLLVPQGNYLIGQVNFKGPCKTSLILFKIEGVIVSATLSKNNVWIYFNSINGIQLEGGTLEGRGQSVWDCKKTRRSDCKGGDSLQFSNCENAHVTGLMSKDSELIHIHVTDSKHVILDRVTITAPGDSPNTDGIHVSRSDDVHILGPNIQTGDDCVSIGPGTTNLWIEHITCGPGHGISIGSLGNNAGEKEVKNITVINGTISSTQNGLRIKTYPKDNPGSVSLVTFQHITMNNVQNPIIIDQHYCDGQAQTCSGSESGVQITGISYIDIHGTSATNVSVNFNCSQTHHCTGLFMDSINLTGKSSCMNAFGKTSSSIIKPPSCLENAGLPQSPIRIVQFGDPESSYLQ